MSELLKQLTSLKGIPGNEKQVRLFFEEQVKEYGEMTHDQLGSAIVEKVGLPDGPRIMVAGHMDEIGFIVTEITKDGYVKFIPNGGWWGHVVLSQQFTITTRAKGEVHAVVGSKPPHILGVEERNKVVDLKDMYLDLGVANKEEALALGVQVGDMVTPFIDFRRMGNSKYLLAKAFDDRIGVALIIDVLKQLKDVAHPNRFFGAATVQEEVGLRGAGTAAYKISPDIGIALDVTIAHDYPGGTKETEMGKGPCLMVMDSSMVGHTGLREYTAALCEELKIPYQLSYLRQGGTDAGKIHINQTGAPSIAICLASRYIHSHTSMIHQDDYDNAVKIVLELVKRLDRKTVNQITYE